MLGYVIARVISSYPPVAPNYISVIISYYLALIISIKLDLQFKRQRMNGNTETIDYQDTSLKKYPFNKYYNFDELKDISKRVFDQKKHSQTINHSINHKENYSKNKKSSHSQKLRRKSINNYTTKTMSSSRLRHKVQTANTTITLDNYKDFNKNEIAQQLHHYTNLCLGLRKENCQLRAQLAESKRNNKQTLIQLQRKVNRMNQKSLDKREKQLKQEQMKLLRGKQNKRGNRQNMVVKKQSNGDFKRFFLHFLDHYGRVDQKLHKKIISTKCIEKKLITGQKILKESCEFLKQKKYKFNCIFE